MILDVKFLPAELQAELHLNEKVCIVLDIFRASSTIITALQNGCICIQPMSEIAAARAAKSIAPELLLAGERQSIKIEGFDFGNSPLEFSREQINGHKLVMNTSNGTKAILACSIAQQIFIGAFINARVVVRQALNSTRDITIVCAGTSGEFSLEDSLCAGYMVELITAVAGYQLTDTAYAALLMYQQAADNLLAHAARSSNGRRLYEIGLATDVDYCLRLNSTETVGVYQTSSGMICKL